MGSMWMKTTNVKAQSQQDELVIEDNVDSQRFSITDQSEIVEGLKHLDDHGYAVFSDVLTTTEILKSIDLFWNFIENLPTIIPISRNDPTTWGKEWPGSTFIGLINQYGMGQSPFMWSIRGNPNVKKVFSHIWNEENLLVSFDGAGCFRNWHLSQSWRTAQAWFHCDQNPKKEVNRCSIQGLVSLMDSDELTGGFVALPGSHKHFTELKSLISSAHDTSDYVQVPSSHPLVESHRPRLIKCKAGDLIVWDSRTIHCNTPGVENNEQKNIDIEKSGLLRLVGYVCMSPLSMFVPDKKRYPNLQAFLNMRKSLVQKRIGCSHWPLKIVTSGGRDPNELPLQLSDYQRSLIVGDNVPYAEGQETRPF